MRTRESDVRTALHAKLLVSHHDDPTTLVVDELGLLYGEARVDVAVVNGEIHGYEIKSDADTLDRLDHQVGVYSATLDRVTLVVGAKHAENALARVPTWWGLKIAEGKPRGAVTFRSVRRSGLNPSIDAVAVASLLWRQELACALSELDAYRGYASKSRHHLAQRLASVLSIKDLRKEVRLRLKMREGWRADSPQT